jgi:hypothetical protein
MAGVVHYKRKNGTNAVTSLRLQATSAGFVTSIFGIVGSDLDSACQYALAFVVY